MNKVAEQIRKSIKCIPERKPFGYVDLGIAAADFYSAAKALERLQKKGTIKKISKGLFYIPEKSIFGELGPDNNLILERYMFQNGKRIAYVTGFSLYNILGLTTQMAFKIKVATSQKPIKICKGALNVSSVKSYVVVTDQNYQLLGYLDALKDIRKIPDCSVSQAIRRMTFLIKALSSKDKDEIIKYALFYPARTRALLGAILENLDSEINLDELKASLNPLTKISLNLKEKELPTIKKWNIG